MDERISQVERKVDDLMEKLESFETTVEAQLSKISRGLYGDEDNESKGMIKRLGDVETRVKDLEIKDKKEEVTITIFEKVFYYGWRVCAMILLIILIIKGILGPEALLKLL